MGSKLLGSVQGSEKSYVQNFWKFDDKVVLFERERVERCFRNVIKMPKPS